MPYAVDIKIGRMMIPDHKTSTAACSGGIFGPEWTRPPCLFDSQSKTYCTVASQVID